MLDINPCSISQTISNHQSGDTPHMSHIHVPSVPNHPFAARNHPRSNASMRVSEMGRPLSLVWSLGDANFSKPVVRDNFDT